ncbi:MAG: site-specific DNA-methyltransferase, partial [Verrucomicrobia bacterium]
TDNWLRGWFCGIDTKAVAVWQLRGLDQWREAMRRCFGELLRVLKPGAWIAFEVGEVRRGKVRLEEHVLQVGVEAGLKPVAVMINSQNFTKTANCWGVTNARKGTNTNRIVLFRKRRV